MSKTTRRALVGVPCAVAAAVLSGGLALAASPVAAAKGSTYMNVNASGGAGTTIDRDGTEGSFTNSVQGVVDADGDQDVDALYKLPPAASVQFKSPISMTK